VSRSCWPGGVGDIDGVAHFRQLAIRADLAVAGPGGVEYSLVSLAGGGDPDFDNLDAVEVAGVRIAQRRDEKAR